MKVKAIKARLLEISLSDGRERTVNDYAHKMPKVDPQTLRSSLGELRDEGLLKSSHLNGHGLVGWRAK